ncbi:TetR/AcrR family transcriptional regulator [Streptosporangium saharense]|uniref:AcrR family transcriptional regulator n=1 Tax=Streptosporangium saharense TaxID=1706840 RepID=A0A7W7QU11_9ACTN|nr:TetR/AcrR family transcriptional regulator [Streptosporangium saharense]MBB4919765.1 AcrR family transcriptional regulator [Streptosporangium saharense]
MTPPRKPGRTAQETRERLLDAAAAEFGAKGYAGARTACIAARAGVNQQLISYHFGGKRGLLDELRRRWQETQATTVPPGASFADALRAHLDATLDRPDRARLAVWQALGDCPFTDAEADRDLEREATAEAVAEARRRQENGEIRAGIDPAFALLAAYAIALAPVTMPQFVRDILGGDPLSPETREVLRTQLVKLLTDD